MQGDEVLSWSTVSSRGVILHPRGNLAVSGGIFGCHHLEGRRALLAASGQRPEMLLISLQCTGQHPQHK